MGNIKIIECPRDAMQGIEEWIPTEKKEKYIKKLLSVGFDTIDFGSFVSPKAIPQMRDTPEIIQSISREEKGSTKLLAIVANQRGASDALQFPLIDFLGFPLSLSETFQERNTNKSIDEAFAVIREIQALASGSSVKQVVYLSMGFGNPYGDPYDEKYILDFVERLVEMGVEVISLADTIGVSNPEKIEFLFSNLIPRFPEIEFGAHLHSTPDTAQEKVQAILDVGCYRIDSAIKGYGGCPMAKDDLTGNLDTIQVLSVMEENKKSLKTFSRETFSEAVLQAGEVFPA